MRMRGGVGAGGPGEDAGESAFAGAVFADQGVNFSGAEVEMGVAEGGYSAVVLADLGGGEDLVSKGEYSVRRSALYTEGRYETWTIFLMARPARLRGGMTC